MIQLYDFEELNSNFFTEMDHESNSPFQNYGWLRTLYETYRHNFLMRARLCYRVAVLRENDIVYAIAPIVLNRYGPKKKSVMCWGYNMQTDYTDFLYRKGIRPEQVVKFLYGIMEVTEKDGIWFSSLPEESLTAQTIRECLPHEVLTRHKCVSIPLGGKGYQEWFEGLSKSMRQNIRTARNRLAVDEKTGELIVYSNCENTMKLLDETAEELQKLYEQRRKALNADKHSIKYRLKCLYRANILRNYSYMKEAMLSNDSSETVVYYINKKIAAFGHALIRSSTESPTFMQVAYNNEFGKYSPGMLMFAEYMKKNEESGRAIRYLDLALGDEKYKYDLGGRDHYTQSVIVPAIRRS